MGLRSRTDYRHIGQISAPPDVAQALQLDQGADVLVRRRVLYANDEPTQIADSYYPWRITAGTALLNEDTGQGGSYGRLADLGYAPARFTERVHVRMPTPAERATLELEATQPVFGIEHIAWTGDGTPVEVVHHTMPGHLWTLLYEWDDEPDTEQSP
jgi:GntR family transcriptional regulator